MQWIWTKELVKLGANVKNLSLVFGISQMSGSLNDLTKEANLMLHSVCIAISSLFKLRRLSQEYASKLLAGRMPPQ